MTSYLVEDERRNPARIPEVDRVMARLRDTARSQRTHELSWREAQLAGMQRLLAEHEEALLSALAADMGKGRGEALLADILSVKPAISHSRRNLSKWMRGRRAALPLWLRPGRAEVRPQPRGVVAVIGPWNYPVQLTLLPTVQAIAAGNCVVVKPSEMTARTAQVLAEVIPRHLDPDAVAVITGGPEETTAIIENDPDLVFFTGSTSVGRRIAAIAGPRLIPMVLELGGKSPVIVADDADLEVAARRIVFTKTVNSGQTCVAADYVLAERAILPRLVDALVREMHHREAQYNGRTMIVSEAHADRLSRLLENHGGKIACGGGIDVDGRRVDLTLVIEPDADSGLMSEEIFGPILPVIGVDDLDEAIRFVNARPHPLALYVFSQSRRTADQIIAETQSGGVCVNHLAMHLVPEDLPFGGVGASGMGRYHGKAGFDTFSHERSVLFTRTRPDSAAVYGPVSAMAQRVLRRVLR